MARTVLAQYGVTPRSIAPPFYRWYLRFKPQTPPPLWGATGGYWMALALAIALGIGIAATLALTAFPILSQATGQPRAIDVLLPYIQFVRSVAVTLGAGMAWATRHGSLREGRSLGLPAWDAFDENWRPSLDALRERATPNQLWLYSLWTQKDFRVAMVIGAVQYVCLLLALPQIEATIGVITAAAYLAICLFGLTRTTRGIPVPNDQTWWQRLSGFLGGATCIVMLLVFIDIATAKSLLAKWTIIVTSLAAILHLLEWTTFVQQRKLAHNTQRIEQERLLADARLAALKAQIEPHFVFNTISHLRNLIANNPPAALRMADELADFLRASLNALRDESTTVKNEMELARAYLEIAKLRFGERLSTEVRIAPEVADARIPPLLLLTLVENAIQHGIEPKTGAAQVSVIAERGMHNGAASLSLTVTDNGAGFGAASIGGGGMGLANVRERLRSLYGAHAALKLSANTPTGVIATLQIPIS